MKTALLALLALSLVTACSTPPTAHKGLGPWSFEDVQAQTWRLVELDGQAVLPNERPTLAFGEEGISGEGGVNRYSGAFQREGEGGIRFGPLVTTRMAGPPELMDQEARFLRTLEEVDSYRVVSETLQLLREGRVRLAFTRASEF